MRGGKTAYWGGLAAEEQVAAFYRLRGASLVAERWRGSAGEIDLIFRHGATLVFVEVKRAATRDLAALRLGPAQMRRIIGAASEFLAGEPNGQDSELRFDLALVDGRGMVDVIENAFTD